MDERQRRAFAAYIIGINLLPPGARAANDPIPNDRRSRLLRALQFLALCGVEATDSKAARAAGIPRGTVASWMHRDPDFRELAASRLKRAAVEIADLEEEPLDAADLGAMERIEALPAVELARIAVGEVPSRRFMETVFPPGEDNDAGSESPGWLGVFPRYEEQ